MRTFIVAYVKSMRLYYSFITGIAGWIGVAYYDFLARSETLHTIEIAPSSMKKMVILCMLFLSWGINQIINDFLGLKEDRINAPQRPMVTGELHPGWALAVSSGLMMLSAIITWVWLEPVAVLFLVAGVALNIIYEFAKGYGVLGNIIFGLMITMAPLYGGYASGPTQSTVLLSHRISVLGMVFVLNAVMTFYTYFKDYTGDKLAGKKTLVVEFGIPKARGIAIGTSFLPTLVFVGLRLTGMHTSELNNTFYILGGLTVALQVWTGYLYFKHPTGIQSYQALDMNFRACTCGQAALIAIFNPDLAIWLFLFSYILIGFLFKLHSNPAA
jgi:geranylgeranylglycerol-phosphate geranylgeranyltransferase